MDLADLLDDLLDEQASLDEIVAPLSDRHWNLPTPSPRWSVTDQIGHLCYFDRAAALAIRDPDAFADGAGRIMEALLESETSGDDYTLADFRRLDAAGRLESWRQGRAELAEAAGTSCRASVVFPHWRGPTTATTAPRWGPSRS